MGARTPEFVRWTLALSCPLREQSDWRRPEATERLLRALAECGRAVREMRVFDGVALAPPRNDDRDRASNRRAFRVDETLAAYARQEAVERLCSSCPANVPLESGRPGWAGCFGELPRVVGSLDLAEHVEQVVLAQGAGDAIATEFPPTHPRWYGLWVDRAPSPHARRLLERIAAAVASPPPAVTRFVGAVRASLASGLPLHVELAPEGEIVGDEWIVASHCPRCKAPRTPGRSVCPVCRDINQASPTRRRRRRGDRPYRPLSSILGHEGARAFLARASGAGRAEDRAG